MSSLRISYSTLPDASAEAELSTLANVYALALQKYSDKHEATRPGSPNDAKEIKNDSRHQHRST